MGYYINPPSETKEEFLAREGTPAPTPEPWALPEGQRALVCYVDNGPFSAAGVVFDAREAEAFTDPSDYRPRSWFLVDINKLYPVVDGLERVFPRSS